MARTSGRLTALGVDRTKAPGLYADGGGLHLQVTGDGKKNVGKSWVYRFMLRSRSREMGLGSLSAFSLADARAAAAECRKLRQLGIDPIEARKAEREKAALEAAKAVTFKECGEQYIAAHRAAWRNAKHASQWENTLRPMPTL